MIRRVAACLLGAAAVALALPAAAAPPRVASINVCTDELVLALADPPQILGLSPYSRDASRAFSAEAAARYPRLSGLAEDVLVLRPDLVVAGAFTNRATRELLARKGLRVETFSAAQTLGEARAQILRMGDLLHRGERAAALVARLDEGVVRAREVAARLPKLRILPLSRRGWVSGPDSLMSSLLAVLGLESDADRLGLPNGGFATLEAIVAARPDLLLVESAGEKAEDQGTAYLTHPALARLYPIGRRLVVPEPLTVCAGPMLVEALERIASELRRVAGPERP